MVVETGISGFANLHPAIQYHIVNSLGWPSLRPLQERSIAPILGGRHALLIAPTAGGKTEAAILPVLSRMLSEQWSGLCVLYICPIKALLNNLESRLHHLAGLVGRSVQLWHADVTPGSKRQFEGDPPDILLTTPESIEGILLGTRRDHQRLLGDLRCVVVDEIHAFAGDDRGSHLLALLERLQQLNPQRIQRIGLSATVGDPTALLDWLAAHAPGKRELVQIPTPPADVDLQFDYVGSLANAAILISQLHRGEKRLVFCDSRNRVEQLSLALRDLGVDVYVSHAALSADTRRQAEQAFAERQNCVIVATSTLELGLDVGDLDRVIQIDAPGSVASFLQRLGRTGRRMGGRRNMLFIATRDDGLLESLAIVQLFRRGFVEPVRSPPMPHHLVVQQLFAMLLQHGNDLLESDFLQVLGRVPGLAQTLRDSWPELSGHLVAIGYLNRSGMRLSLGLEAERIFRGKGLADLCVSFESPRMFAAMHGNVLLGHVDPLSLTARKDGPIVLALGGRSWRVVSIDWSRALAHVEPTEEKGASRWLGEARGVSRAIAGQVRTLIEHAPSSGSMDLSRRAAARLEEIRTDQEDTLREVPARLGDGSWEWWTYQGLAANQILAAQIAAAGGVYSVVDAYCLRFTLSAVQLERVGHWSGLRLLQPRWSAQESGRFKFSNLLTESMRLGMSLERVQQLALPLA